MSTAPPDVSRQSRRGDGRARLLRAEKRPPRLPLAFSTLGCPAWSWKTILETADRLGYAGLELRGIAGEMDLTKVRSSRERASRGRRRTSRPSGS